jgi:apolipoprotein N-acyltransferase
VSIIQFGGVNLALALVITLGFALLMALFYGLAGWLAARLTGAGTPLARLAALAGAWVLAEWVRGWVLGGFPWLALGYSQIDLPPAGYAPLFGVYGVSLVVVLSAALLLAWRRYWPLLPLVGLWGGGWLLGQVDWTPPAGPAFQVSIIQGNVAQQVKWRREQLLPTLQLYTELTRDAADSRLVIWPETAVPAFAHRVEEEFLRPLADWTAAAGRDVLLGIPVQEPDGRYYNAMLNVGVSGRGSYYKRHLVPFGEFMPLRPLLEPLIALFAIPLSEFSAGEAETPLLRTAGYAAAISICYEDAFGTETIEGLPEAAFLVNASNDAWFGDSLAPHQHLEIARMRALETGRYLLRAANTGISAVIGPRGQLRATAPQFERAVLTAPVEPRAGATPYVRLGNAAVVAFALLLLLAGAAYRRGGGG